jgi:hypothetical protein
MTLSNQFLSSTRRNIALANSHHNPPGKGIEIELPSIATKTSNASKTGENANQEGVT